MIVTVTPNPAVDQTIWIDRLEPGHPHRARESQLDAAGKGINVSRMAARMGGATLALGVLAGETGRIVEERLDEERVQHHFVHVGGRTRVNLNVVEPGARRETSFLDRGPDVTPDDIARLDATVATWIGAAKVLVLAGSLPPGMPAAIYRHWVMLARAAGAITIVDAEGDAMREALASGPSLIKPNRHEAEELLGRPIHGLEEAVIAALDLSTPETSVVLSLAEGGSIVATGGEIWRVIPPQVTLRSTIGSGDSLVAGIAMTLATGGSLLDGVALGTAAGAATAAAPGTALGDPAEVRRLSSMVRVERLFEGALEPWRGNAS